MRLSGIQLAQYGLQSDGNAMIHPWRRREPYTTFKSQYGPNIQQARVKVAAYNIAYFRRIAPMVGSFGVAAGIFALYFFNGIPRVQKDIYQKIPFLAKYFTHEIPPEDNPF